MNQGQDDLSVAKMICCGTIRSLCLCREFKSTTVMWWGKSSNDRCRSGPASALREKLNFGIVFLSVKIK